MGSSHSTVIQVNNSNITIDKKEHLSHKKKDLLDKSNKISQKNEEPKKKNVLIPEQSNWLYYHKMYQTKEECKETKSNEQNLKEYIYKSNKNYCHNLENQLTAEKNKRCQAEEKNDEYIQKIQLLENKIEEIEEGKKRESEQNQNLQKLIDSLSQTINQKNNEIEKNEKTTREINKKMGYIQRKDNENSQKVDSMKKKVEKLEKDNIILKKLIQEEKNERKKKELEEKLRAKEIQINFNKSLDKYELEKLASYVNDFEIKKSKTFCQSDISKSIMGKITIIVLDILTIEQMTAPISVHLDNLIESARNKIKPVEHFNAILVGPSGAGKSTLINQALSLNVDTGFGSPVTKKIGSYTSSEIPFLRLIDSKGIEKDRNSDINSTFREISNFIKEKIKTNNPDEYIHGIWYCWASDTRLENVEFDLLQKLSQQYTLDKLPVIIVYTKAISQEDIEKGKMFLKEKNIKNDFIPILALEKQIGINSTITIPAFGLDNLIDTSIKRAKEAVNSSCYEGLLQEIKKDVESNLRKLVRGIVQKLNAKIETIISEMNKRIRIKDLQNKMTEIIIELFSYFFFLSTDVTIDTRNKYTATYLERNLKKTISDHTLNMIQESVQKNLSDFLDIYQKNYDKLEEEIKNKLLEDVKTFQVNFMLEKKENKLVEMDNPQTLELNLKPFIHCQLSEVAKKAAFKNFFRSMISPLVKQFEIEYGKLCKKIMSEENFREKGKKIVEQTLSFQDIEAKIKKYYEEYNEKKKNNEEEKNVKNEQNEETKNPEKYDYE